MSNEKYEKYREQILPIAELIGIKMSSVEQTLSVYPDEFMGMEFSEEEDGGAVNARAKYSERTQKSLIKAFKSHEWKVYSDIYGHNGLSRGGSCKKCGRKFKFPCGDWTSDNFILAFHYIYGFQKRFGGRITKCKGKK